MRRLILVLALWAAVVGGTGAKAGDLDRDTRGQDVTVAIASPFSVIPPSHIVPFRVTIRNDRSSAGTWQLRSMGSTSMATTGTTFFDQDMTVAANATGVFDVLVPLPTLETDQYGGTNLAVGVSGPGFADGGANDYFARFYSGSTYYSGHATTRSPFTLIGNEVLGPAGLGPLQSADKDRGKEFYGSGVDVADLPSDWRAYSGVASFILKDAEWLSLNAGQREGICDYVAMGGHLTLLTADPAEVRIPQLQLPEPDGKPGPYGFGNITLEPGAVFPAEAGLLNRLLEANPMELAQNVDLGFSTWALRPLVGTIAVSSAFILSFVVLFGTLIGPINLFVFAQGKNRFRLFWTTPLISIAASLALIVSILVTDGLGGSGRQMIAIFSLPGVNREVVIQEQVAHTAVLFSTSWQNTQNYLITPVSTQSMENALGGAARTNDYRRAMADSANTYRLTGNELSGDWFRSRALSGQYLQAVRPSRSALTVLNPQAFSRGEPPEVLSSFSGELDEVYLLNPSGQCWTCRQLTPGRKQTCTPAAAADYDVFWDGVCASAGGKLKPLLLPAQNRAGYFYATGVVPESESLATLGEIRWQVAQGVYLGPWVASASPEGTP